MATNAVLQECGECGNTYYRRTGPDKTTCGPCITRSEVRKSLLESRGGGAREPLFNRNWRTPDLSYLDADTAGGE